VSKHLKAMDVELTSAPGVQCKSKIMDHCDQPSMQA